MDYEKVRAKVISHIVFLKMQGIYDTLKTAERKAADFILERPEDFLNFTIVEAAKASNTSEATFVRLARKLCYSGYTELKAATEVDGDDGPIAVGGISAADVENPADVLRKTFELSIQSMQDTLEIIDPDVYVKALNRIQAAKRLVFAGNGDGYIVAYSGYLKFFRAGYDVACHSDFDLQLIAVSQLQIGDVLLVISHSGRTKTMLDLIKCAKSVGATTILVTNFPTSPLAKQSDFVLCTATFTPTTAGEVIAKRVPEICIVESLYINTLIHNYESFREKMKLSEMMLRINKNR